MKSPHLLLILPWVVSPILAADLFVSNSNDAGTGSLRATLASASDGDVVYFNSALNGGMITLSTGELAITDLDISIDASALALGITISGNNASRIFNISGDSVVSLAKLKLTNGKSSSGGGAVLFLAENLTMTDCVVTNSASGNNGGGLFIGTSTLATPSASFQRCRIQGCTAPSFGGGVYFIGAGQYTLTNTLISGNLAFDGAGMFNTFAEPSLLNCTIQGNRATGNTGGGMATDSGLSGPLLVPIIRNTVFWGNRGTGANIPRQQLRNIDNSNPDVNHSLVEGASSSASFSDGNKTAWGANNLNGSTSNPSFVAATTAASAPSASSDVRLFTGSPCLNSGDNTLVPPLATDLAGRTRIQGGSVDLGAYEGGYETFAHLYPTLSPSGDNDNNGSSNFLEYALGSNPTNPNDPTPSPTMSRDETSLLLTLTQRNNAADLSHVWETTINLAPLAWSTMVEGIDYNMELITNPAPEVDQLVLRLLASDPKRFYRQQFKTMP